MGKKSQKVGSDWETQVERMFRRVPGCHYVVNWNDRATTQARKGGKKIKQDKKPADVTACINGISVLCECKTTQSTSLPFSVIGDERHYTEEDGNPQNNQRNTLLKHAKSGGFSLIAIKQRLKNDSRFWLVSFQHWEVIRRRLFPDRKSIPLNDKNRPAELVEVGRFFFDEFSSKNLEVEEVGDVLADIYETARRTPLVDYRFE